MILSYRIKKNPESKKLLYSAHKVWYTEIILNRNFMGLKKILYLYGEFQYIDIQCMEVLL